MKARSYCTSTCLLLISMLCLSREVRGVAQSSNSAELNTTVADTKARQDREDACANVEVNFALMSDEEIQIQRNKDINMFHKSTSLLKEIISTTNWKKIWNGKLWLPILITIVFSLSIISVILYFVNIFFCCKRKQSGMADWCVRINLCLALLAFVIFLVSVIGMTVFIASTRTSIKYVSCAIQIMSDDIRNGAYYKENELKFQGVLPLTNIMTEYGISLEKLVSLHTNDINNVVTASLPALSKEALDAVDPYYTKYKDSLTSDGLGTQSKPKSITETLLLSKGEMTAEFSLLYQTCLNVHEAASIGKKMIDTGDAQIFKAAVEQATKKVDDILKNFDEYITLSNKYFGTLSNKYDTIQIVYTIFNFICLVVVLIVLIGLCCAFRKNKCTNLTLWRIMIFVVGLLCVLFFTFTVFVSAISFMTSSSCQIIADLDQPNGIEDFVSTFELDKNYAVILESCYGANATGDFGDIFINEDSSTSAEYQMFNDSHKMLSVYNEYEVQKGSMYSNGNAKSTQKLDDELEKAKIGEDLDHSNVQATLDALTVDVTCAGKYYALTPNTCKPSDFSNCMIIQLESVYPIPSCVAGKTVAEVDASKKRWSDLKTYLNETQALMSSMIVEANGPSPTTLNGQYKTAALKFFDSAVILEKVRVTQKPALDLFKGSLSKQLDCKIIKLHVQILEDSICFTMVGELYSYMVTSVVASILFFCIVWNLCCAEFCISNLREDGEVVERREPEMVAIPTEMDNAAEDDFLFEQAQGGYIDNSESTPGIAKDRNIEYKVENEPLDADEDDIPTPIFDHGDKDVGRVNH